MLMSDGFASLNLEFGSRKADLHCLVKLNSLADSVLLVNRAQIGGRQVLAGNRLPAECGRRHRHQGPGNPDRVCSRGKIIEIQELVGECTYTCRAIKLAQKS
jgi:hypothetical protein